MTWERVLHGRFVRLKFQNRMDGDPPRTLDARAFYRVVDEDRYEGTWFDSRGMVLPLDARGNGTTLTTHWGTPDTEQGRTVYRLVDDQHMEVQDFVLKGDVWHALPARGIGSTVAPFGAPSSDVSLKSALHHTIVR